MHIFTVFRSFKILDMWFFFFRVQECAKKATKNQKNALWQIEFRIYTSIFAFFFIFCARKRETNGKSGTLNFCIFCKKKRILRKIGGPMKFLKMVSTHTECVITLQTSRHNQVCSVLQKWLTGIGTDLEIIYINWIIFYIPYRICLQNVEIICIIQLDFSIGCWC